MAFVMVHSNVEDFKKWTAVFNQHTAFRAQHGSKGGKVFQVAGNPNEVFVLLEWDTLENAKIFSQSDELRERMQQSGVVGRPDIYFVEEAATTKA